MAHRLTSSSMRRVDRILKIGPFTGNFTILAQVQFPCKFKRFLSQPIVYFSHEPLRGFHKISHPRRRNNGGAAEMKGKGTAQKTEIDINKRINNAFSNSPSLTRAALLLSVINEVTQISSPTRSPQAPNQNPKFRGARLGNRGPTYDEVTNIGVLLNLLNEIQVECWRSRKANYGEITWKDFVENYLALGRVAKVESIGKNWLLIHTAPGASAKRAVLPRQSEFKVTYSSAYFSNETPNSPDKPLRPNWDKNGGTPKIKEKGTAANKNNDKRTKNLSSTSQPKSAPNALNQDSKYGGKASVVVVEGVVAIFMYISIVMVFFAFYFCVWWHDRKNIGYVEITLTDFVDKYLSRGRVVKPEYLKKEWIQFQIPGDRFVRRVRINNLEFYEVSGLLSTIMDKVNTEEDMKAEQENRIPDKGQSFLVSLQNSLTIIQLLEYGRKAWRLTVGRLTATISEMIFRK